MIRGNALDLPLADNTVDLVVTSPPYFGLRSYQDGGEHYDGQIGAEATPAEFVDALVAATAEMVRVVKPSGSIWVNLGDKYKSASHWALKDGLTGNKFKDGRRGTSLHAIPTKSLIGIPWRYALRCIDDLGLILRAEIIWSKPNGLPESVTDRVRRSHEQWFHFTLEPRYFSAVDEMREAHAYPNDHRARQGRLKVNQPSHVFGSQNGTDDTALHPLGKLPGSVHTVPTEPLRVPDHLGVDHFAAFPTAWPKWIIQGWAPTRGVCVACGEGRRPVAMVNRAGDCSERRGSTRGFLGAAQGENRNAGVFSITGYACACPEPTAATTPPTILDPFGGTGTTALVAKALGCHGITVDMSADYCRLAEWRTNDPGQLAKVLGVDKPPAVDPAQTSLFD